ncbi:MAG: carboxypeptidase Taq [Phycisphaerales bacterium]|jgi:carboxypeptidase Taq|nr:carboxypeptidase Taq [Phycisphaerales bacterium]
MIRTMGDADNTYAGLIAAVKEISLLGSSASVLHWDKETYMPPKGAEARGDQVSLLARLAHEQFTDKKIGAMIAAVEASDLVKDPQHDAAVNTRELRRAYDRATKIPAALVAEISKASVLGHHAWIDARKNSNYGKFKPWLAKMLELRKQEADYVGYRFTPYDALLDEYEPHETTENLKRVFESLRDPLIELVAKIQASPRKAPVEILERKYPAAAQEVFARDAAKAVGFDFDAGRLDISVHPFCTDFSPTDVRMTTRYDEHYFGDAFFGVLHETGHALYGQGLPVEHYGTPLGEAVSLGIHESQSRLWENFVGRSRAFWEFFFPKAQLVFGQQLRDVTLEQWYFAVNDVRPSFIRTESDEATYNLHILLRFELEQAMISGELACDDVPAAWNERMEKYFALTPPDDAKGVLQDTHWSGGAFGYFPTYTLGNLYAAQFFEQARKDLGDLDAMFARGDFSPLLNWLRQNIHRHGKRYTARELVKRITGRELSAEPLLNHLRRRAAELYGM